jgi:hypothetical protein
MAGIMRAPGRLSDKILENKSYPTAAELKFGWFSFDFRAEDFSGGASYPVGLRGP